MVQGKNGERSYFTFRSSYSIKQACSAAGNMTSVQSSVTEGDAAGFSVDFDRKRARDIFRAK
jgi:hypothetical protein